MGGEQWQLQNLNENMQESREQINLDAELKVLHFVLWEYKK